MKNKQKHISQLWQEIEILREQLELMLKDYKIDEDVIKKSRELDLLINEYIELKLYRT
ncbi:MAG TPA: Spo0E family sporulation regulatory protein-aspartic acid phosphatase [Thermoanaerobacterales bacterium]|nr:Spo0E family sporulation regulatory protein-aspartic acid phosphatase [Thermoanaerobacterales bacterium]